MLIISKSSGGSGNGADSKELLVCSVTSCYIETLTYMLECRKLPVAELIVNSKVTLSDSGFNIVHYPQIVLFTDASEAQVESAQRIIEGADRGSKVGDLLRKAGINIEVQGKVSMKKRKSRFFPNLSFTQYLYNIQLIMWDEFNKKIIKDSPLNNFANKSISFIQKNK